MAKKGKRFSLDKLKSKLSFLKLLPKLLSKFPIKKLPIKLPAKLSVLLLWKVVLGVSFVFCVTTASMLWFSGGDETTKALNDGRRLVFSLANGEIQGRIIESQPAADKQPATEEKPKASESPDKQAQSEGEKPPEGRPLTEEQPPTTKPPEEQPKEAPDQPESVALPESTTPLEQNPTGAPDTAAPQPDQPSPAPDQPAPQSDQIGPQPDMSNVPVPLTYSQLSQISTPSNQSSVPAVLPDAAPSPPLMNDQLPDVKPAQQQPATLNDLLTEKSKEGVIPVVAADGTKAWKFYSKPFDKKSREPMIAIIVTGLGQNNQVTQHAMVLPENVTLAFSPYSSQLEQWSKSARLSGHEMMLELPMEPVDYPSTDPGPYGLMLGQGAQENERRLRLLMSRIPTSVGFITTQNEKFSSSDDDFKLLLKSMGNRGLMLVMSTAPASNSTKTLLQETSTPNVIADVAIDEELTTEIIAARLYTLEQLAKKKGYAVGIARPYPITIATLKEWMEKLKEKGVVLVPVSAIAKLDFS